MDDIDSGLDGRVAIVTGAGSRAEGIGNGRAAAILLAGQGARVALVDSNPEWAERTREMIIAEGGDSLVIAGDVSRIEDCRRIVAETVARYGRLDILVNNVGIGGPPGTAVDVELEAWNHGLLVNVTSMMLMAKYAIPEMLRHKKGAIVNIASVAGLRGGHPNLLYATSKGAVVNMTRAMAAQHGKDGIRVNCVCPGMGVHADDVRGRHVRGDARGAAQAVAAANRGFGLGHRRGRALSRVRLRALGHRHDSAGRCGRDCRGHAAELRSAAMHVDDIVRAFDDAGDVLPEFALRAALDDWELARPRFLELLNRCAEGLDRSDATKSALFFIIHLLGEKRETDAFPSLCRLLQNAELSESVLGDAVTENLRGILINTYDGDPQVLKRLIEFTAADEFVRAAALDAWAYLAGTGMFTEEDARNYLRHLLAEMRPQDECFVWEAWVSAVANLGYSDFGADAETLITRGFVGEQIMDRDDFREQLRLTLDDPERMAGFERDRVAPFADTIGTLSRWYAFTEKFQLDRERWAAERENRIASSADAPYINPLRHVGRNDPCPCGSGKKYKKCCLLTSD